MGDPSFISLLLFPLIQEMLFSSNKSLGMTEFVSTCSYKKNWTVRLFLDMTFNGSLFLVKLEMYT